MNARRNLTILRMVRLIGDSLRLFSPIMVRGGERWLTNGRQTGGTVREVLQQIGEFHERLAGRYGGLATTCANAGTRMLAEYMAQRESGSRPRSPATKATCATPPRWPTGPKLPEKLRLDGVTLSPDISTDDLSNFGVALDETLRAFVKDISDAATSLRVRELFADLMAQEEREQRQTSRATFEVEREL